jgi:hypothetical protein
VTGGQFRGIAESSSGSTSDSPTDYPLVQLQSIETGQMMFLLATNWSTNKLVSAPVTGFPPGYALATVFVNGIQSTSSIVNVSVPIPVSTILNNVAKLTNGIQFNFTNNVNALIGVLTTTNLTQPLANWTPLGGVTEISPGQYQFTDIGMKDSKRFYCLFAP